MGIKREAVMEAKVWSKVSRHANVVCLKKSFLQDRLCFFVMEKCDGSLLTYLESWAGSELNEFSLGSLFAQMLRACDHIHKLGIVHRDIKPDNFLTKQSVVKMCDFGLADVMPATLGLCGVFGTAPYMAPEMLKNHRYGCKVDIWSMGVVAYVLLFGEFPYTPAERTSLAMKRVIR